MNKRILGALLGILAGSLVTTAYADDGWTPGSTHLSLEAGLAAGGDKLATVFDTSGNSHDIHAGNSLFTDVGVQHNFGGTDFSLRGTAGYSFTGVSARNGTISFTYIPVNLLGIYSVGNSHFGAGLAVHVSPHMDMDGFAPNADFQTATGLVLQYQYWLFGVRYTNIKYKISNLSGGATCISNCSFDGSSIGLFFNYVF